MYLPYLRGKQFELVALRDMSVFLRINREKISPIVEPVKNSSTLKSTIKALADKQVNFTVIVNPKEGQFRNSDDILELLDITIGQYDNFQAGILLDGRIDATFILELLQGHHVPALTLIHNGQYDNIRELVDEVAETYPIKFNVINLKKIHARYSRSFDRATVVELDDYFNSQAKNADYLEIEDSRFSEEHLYYVEEGLAGFSDYLTVGDNYSESGFLPYA